MRTQTTTYQNNISANSNPEKISGQVVLSVLSDRLFSSESSVTTGLVDYYVADLVSSSDYYPFGMMMPGRNFSGDKYRYGFNGQEKETEITGSESHYSAEYWMYDSRLGRRWNLDPKPNASISEYATFANSPVFFSDPFGDTLRFNGNDGFTLTIIASGENYDFDVDVAFEENATVDLGVDALEDFMIGFQATGTVSAQVGTGFTGDILINRVLFFDSEYGGYWYDFVGVQGGGEVGVPSVSAAVEGSFFIGVHKDVSKDYGPSSFEGYSSYVSGEFGLKVWGNISVFGQRSESKSWIVYEAGASLGVDAIPTIVDVNVSGGGAYSKCINDIKPTTKRSWWDITSNWIRTLSLWP